MPTLQFPDILFWLVLGVMLVYFGFNILRRGGLKAAFFNARISDTMGEIEATGPKLVSQRLKVHALDRDGTTLVGVEVISKTFASYQMMPLVLSKEQAKELASLLVRASGQR